MDLNEKINRYLSPWFPQVGGITKHFGWKLDKMELKSYIESLDYVEQVMDDFTIKMCTGVMNEASHYDVDLVVVPVKYIDRDLTGLQDVYEYQYKINERNITKIRTDGRRGHFGIQRSYPEALFMQEIF